MSPSSPYPDRRAGTGLYAFVEGNASDTDLLDFLGAARPEHLQIVETLPRNPQGEVRSEILELVAMNQLDLIDPLVKTDAERAIVGRIVSEPAQSARPLCILTPFRRIKRSSHGASQRYAPHLHKSNNTLRRRDVD